MGAGKVIIIKPDNPHCREMIKKPIKFSMAIKESPFSKFPIKDIRTNQIRNHTVIEFTNIDRTDIEKLLEVKKLGQWDIRCSMPHSDRFKIGVIRPIDVDEDLEDIRAIIQIKLGSMQPKSSTTIHRIERLSRKSGDQWVPSESLKITFCADALPEGVTIGHNLYRLRHYIGEPLQCYKCNMLWHTAAGCRGRQKCNLCGKDHKQAECPVKGKPEEYFCTNCKGNHKSNSSECRVYREGREIENIRIQQNKTISEARNIVKRKYEIPAMMDGPSVSRAVQSRSYSSVLAGSRQSVVCREVSTQTEKIVSTGRMLEPPTATAEFLGMLKVCLLEIFQSNIFVGSSKNQALTIEKAVEHCFNKKTTELDWSNCSDGEGVISDSGEDKEAASNFNTEELSCFTGDEPDPGGAATDGVCTVVGVSDYLASSAQKDDHPSLPPFVNVSQTRTNKRKAPQNSKDSKGNNKKGKHNKSK